MRFQEVAYLGDDVSAALETEALQTDIQRFIAILGFCLMAVFALVQSIPVTEPDLDLALAHLERTVAAQKEQLDELMSENRRLKMETDLLIQHSHVALDLRKKLEAARRSLRLEREKMERLIQEKVNQSQELIQYEAALRERDKKIHAFKTVRDRIKNTLEKILDTNTAEVVKLPVIESAGIKKGRYVAFESDSVFMGLLTSEKIELFIDVEGMNQAFKVFNGPEGIQFAPGNPAGLDLWEIESSTVPQEIIIAFRAWTTLSSQKKRFIVGLTPPISRPIRKAEKRNGRFLIKTGGVVVYTPYGG